MKEAFYEVFTSKLVSSCIELTDRMGKYEYPVQAISDHVNTLRAYTELAYNIDILETYNEYIEFETIIDMLEEEAYELMNERGKK